MKQAFVVIVALVVCAGVIDCTHNGMKRQPEQTEPGVEALRLDRSSRSVVVTDTMHGLGDTLAYSLEVRSGQTLSIAIAPDSVPANVRIRQIIAPSGAADGPFGLQADYKARESGTWKIVVDESLMAGEDYRGGFTMRVSVR